MAKKPPHPMAEEDIVCLFSLNIQGFLLSYKVFEAALQEPWCANAANNWSWSGGIVMGTGKNRIGIGPDLLI